MQKSQIDIHEIDTFGIVHWPPIADVEMEKPKVIRETGMQETVCQHRNTLVRGWRGANEYDSRFSGLFQEAILENYCSV
jgi:hypothetical protein